MELQIHILFNPITRQLRIKENDFSTFEAFGILQGAIQMIADDWHKRQEEDQNDG